LFVLVTPTTASQSMHRESLKRHSRIMRR